MVNNEVVETNEEKIQKEMAQKALTLKIMPEDIKGSEIMKQGEYKYASVGVKMGENEYLRISYEWKGDGVPEFVMGIMNWMTANENGDGEIAMFLERTNPKEAE